MSNADTLNQVNHAMFIFIREMPRNPAAFGKLNIGNARLVSNETFSEQDRIIIGDNNDITVERCIVVGNKNTVHGKDSVVYGLNCTVSGPSCTYTSSSVNGSSATSDRLFGVPQETQVSAGDNYVLSISSSRKRSSSKSSSSDVPSGEKKKKKENKAKRVRKTVTEKKE